MTKKQRFLLLVIAAIVQQAIVGSALGEGNFSFSTEALAKLQFPVPENTAEVTYLGFSGKRNFSLPETRADILLIEIFSMYCPICQAEAPAVNQLYDFIESNPQTRGRIKIIGIGTGNTPFEVDVFRKKYKIHFPLFPDENMLVRKACSEDIRTPTFLIVKPEHGKGISLLQTHVGQIKDAKSFMTNLVGRLPAK